MVRVHEGLNLFNCLLKLHFKIFEKCVLCVVFKFFLTEEDPNPNPKMNYIQSASYQGYCMMLDTVMYTSVVYCPKNNMNLSIQAEPIASWLEQIQW